MHYSRFIDFCQFFAPFLYVAVVIDTDGSAFITKAEFDSLKNNFQAQIDNYNSSIDSKIDGAIASYLAGIKMSSTVALQSVDMGAKFIEIRDTNSTDSGLYSTELTALKIDYNWKYCAYYSSGSYADTLSRIEMGFDGAAATFNGLIYQNGEYIYTGYRKYKVIKTSDLLRIYNGYGASIEKGLNKAYTAVLPVYAGDGWVDSSHPCISWVTYKEVPSSGYGSYKVYSRQAWNGNQKTNSGWWQSREWGLIAGAGTMECFDTNNKAEYHITSQTYEREDNESTDRIINIYDSSSQTVLYSLNKWDGMGFSKFVNSTGTKWDNEFGLKITSWNNCQHSTGVTTYIAANEVINQNHWRATSVSNTPIRDITFSELRYEKTPTIYNSTGGSSNTKIKLDSNIPLVNITSDGVVELDLVFNNDSSKKIWLDTVLANTFTSKRDTALTPEGYTLDSTGGFNVSGTDVTLKVPVKKNTTVMIKIARNTTSTDCILTLPSEYTLTIEG